MIISVLRSTKDSKFLGFYVFFKYRRNLKWFEVEYVIGIFYFYLVLVNKYPISSRVENLYEKANAIDKIRNCKEKLKYWSWKEVHIKINIYKVYIDQTATGCTLIILSSLLNFLK